MRFNGYVPTVHTGLCPISFFLCRIKPCNKVFSANVTFLLPTHLGAHCSMNSTFLYHKIRAVFSAECNTSKHPRQLLWWFFWVIHLKKNSPTLLKQILATIMQQVGGVTTYTVWNMRPWFYEVKLNAFIWLRIIIVIIRENNNSNTHMYVTHIRKNTKIEINGNLWGIQWI